MLASTRRGISYPDLDRHDRPDIPLHLKNLVDALEIDMIYAQGTNAARLGRGHVAGVFFYETDTTVTFYDDGVNWHQITSSAGGRYFAQCDVDWIPPSDNGLKTMLTLPIKGGDLGPNGQFYVDIWGYERNGQSTTHQNLTVSMSWGGSTVFTTMWPGYDGSNGNGPNQWHMVITIMNKDVTHQVVQFVNDATGYGANGGKSGYASTVINTAVDQNLVLTGQYAGAAFSSNQLHVNQLVAQIR